MHQLHNLLEIEIENKHDSLHILLPPFSVSTTISSCESNYCEFNNERYIEPITVNSKSNLYNLCQSSCVSFAFRNGSKTSPDEGTIYFMIFVTTSLQTIQNMKSWMQQHIQKAGLSRIVTPEPLESSETDNAATLKWFSKLSVT